jgi:NAD(P)-dependent dehydrogenase (short-subunit alcohol dehydrogenase family)
VVALCDLKGAVAAAEALRAEGYHAYGYEFDITDREAVAAAMERIATECWGIDVLVNNAGINVGPDQRKHVDEFSDEWWDAILKVDLDGTYNCTKAAIPHMPKGSAIVNISSIVGMVPLRNQCAFTAAKAAVINFTKAIAMELAPQGIRANVVCPGTIGIAITNRLWQKNDAMAGLLSHIPMGRQGVPDEIANATAFLASELASYITGAVLPVDGGWTCGGFARDF